jgi:hypothetical protein
MSIMYIFYRKKRNLLMLFASWLMELNLLSREEQESTPGIQ